MVRSLTAMASPHLLDLLPYSPGRPIEEVEREFGVAGAAKLASNENPFGPSPLAVKAVQEAAAGVHRYPDGAGTVLKARLAEHLAVDPAQIALGNGSNELLDLVTRIFLQPGDEAVMATPAFIVYRMACQALGAVAVEVPCRDFVHDLPAMAAAVTSRTKLLFVGNPNNPTGTAVPPAALDAFVRRLPPEPLLVVDEACNPVEGADVDIWHTGNSGHYSGPDASDFCTGADPDAKAHQYFRGVQTTDAKGRVDFDTCYPGWYPGRSIHIHFTVRVANQAHVTSQLFFPDTLTAQVFAEHPDYDQFGQPNTTNAQDGIYAGNEYELSTALQPDGALLAWKVLVIRSSLAAPLCSA